MAWTCYFCVFALFVAVTFRGQGQGHSDAEETKSEPIFSNFSMSPFPLQKLVECETEIYETLRVIRGQLREEEALTLLVSKYLDDYETSSGNLPKDGFLEEAVVQKIVNNPLAAFRMLFRFVRDLPKVIAGGHGMLDEVLSPSCAVPNEEDLEEAMDGILRLAFTYDLDILEFADGYIHGIMTPFTLEARHAFAIGRHALDLGTYPALAVEWLELAKYLTSEVNGPGDLEANDLDINDPEVNDPDEFCENDMEEPEVNDPVHFSDNDMNELNALLLQAVDTHDKLFDSTISYANTFFVRKIVPKPEIPYEFDGWYRRISQRSRDAERYGGNPGRAYHEINTWTLCSGQNDEGHQRSPPLDCWYDLRIPIFPFRIEQLAKVPLVIQIHNFLSPVEADELVELAQQHMEPSVVASEEGPGQTYLSTERTSYTRWLIGFPLCLKIEKLVETFTALHAQHHTGLQIASYTPFGAHYAFHLDQDVTPLLEHSDDMRIATFMIYLSDVEGGGSTVFLDAQLAVRPSKGSAVFWYNLDPYGDVDFNTHHAACPVFLGTKWVANKWIWSDDQFDRRRCPPKLTKN